MNNISIDFQVIPTFDTKKLIVADSSDWDLISDRPSIIEIIMPGEEEPIVQYYTKNAFNIFNSYNLGLNCETCPDNDLMDLPDGIYHITVKGSPDKYSKTKQVIRTESTRLDLDEVISSIDINCSDISKELISKINKINFFIDASESNTRMGNFCEAQESLFKAQKMISKLNGCKTCV